MNFGEKIKNLRQNKGWTQEYVAEQLKISIPALSRYESGTYEPKSLSIVSDFAKIYNVTTDYLLGLNIDYTDTDESIDIGLSKKEYNELSENAKKQIRDFAEFVKNQEKK